MNSAILNQILLFSSGLVLLLFGMVKLSTKMKNVFGRRIREYIKYLVQKPARGIVFGAIATVFFQSSSAVTVMTVGMVSAGLIGFYNSLGVILGADIGTTSTAQLVAWKFTAISPIFIVIGGLIWILTKRQELKTIGETIFYFGLMFFGLHLLTQQTAILKENQNVINLFEQIRNPFLGVLIGALFAAFIHASAIPVSVLVVLAQQGLVTIESALPIVLGANIGTTATALLASIGTNINGKRTAFAHLLFKFFGVLLVFPFLPIFIAFMKILSHNPAQQIANSHFFFNLLIILAFAPFLKPFSSFVKKIIPGEEEILPLWPEWLDEKILSNPSLALGAVKKELGRQASIVKIMFVRAFGMIGGFSNSKLSDIFYVENVVDNLQSEIAKFLHKLSKSHLEKKETIKLFHYAAMVDDIERMGDHAINISKLAGLKRRYQAPFSEIAQKEINDIQELVFQNLDDAIFLIENPASPERIKNIEVREEIIDEKVQASKEAHMERFYKGACRASAGPIFVDIMVNLERISDHCVNISEYAKDLA